MGLRPRSELGRRATALKHRIAALRAQEVGLRRQAVTAVQRRDRDTYEWLQTAADRLAVERAALARVYWRVATLWRARRPQQDWLDKRPAGVAR